MDGFTVSNANRFLETGRLPGEKISGTGDSKSMSIGSAGGTSEPSKSFADTLNEAISNVNQLHHEADKSAENLATGRTDNIAEVMLTMEKADLALKLMVQVRNKIIDAYQDIMKMQV